MGWFKRIGDQLLAHRRKAAFDKDPSAENLVRLVQLLLSMGEPTEAHRFTCLGIKSFPHDELVHELHRIATQQRARKGVEQARAEIESSPSRRAYLKLARDSLTLRDSDTARKALEECVQRYPDCAAAYAGLAQLHERLFLWDLAADDGHRLIRYATEAQRLNPSDPDPTFHLALFYERIGALGHARKAAEHVQELDRSHSSARAFLERLPPAPAAEDESMVSLLQQIEEHGRLPGGDMSERHRIARELARYRTSLAELRQSLDGARCIVVGPEGEAWDDAGPAEPDALVSLVHGLTRTTQLATRRVGLGPMRAITLETAGGTVLLRRGSRGTISCLLPKGTVARGIQQLLKRVMQVETSETAGKATS
ncbi:MAG: tetratricopeptide repeat protein [Planctomycetota bacterium]